MPAGRPPKLTREIIDEIVRALRMGAYLETAAAYVGIEKQTLHRWLREGARKQSLLAIELSYSVQKALAEGELADLAVISKAAKSGNWTASAWRLERKFPARWGRRDPDHDLKTQLLEADLKRSQTELDLLKAKLKEVTQNETREPLEIRILPFELKQPSE